MYHFSDKREKCWLKIIGGGHADKKWLERLKRHLKPLVRKGYLDCWDDTHIRPGDDWQQEIRAALDTAQVVVLLISADFFASDFIDETELPPLLTAAQAEGVSVLPVILSASRFARTRIWLEAVNSPDGSLNKMSEGEQEEVLERLAQTIESALDHPWSLPAYSAHRVEGLRISLGAIRGILAFVKKPPPSSGKDICVPNYWIPTKSRQLRM